MHHIISSTDGSDYFGVNEDLTFNQDSVSSRAIPINILGDMINEPVEFFHGCLSTTDSDVTLYNQCTRITIHDNDGKLPT